MQRSTWFLAVTLILATYANAPAQTLGLPSPLAVQPGQTTELTLTGAELQDALSLWLPFPAKSYVVNEEKRKPTKDKATFRVETPADTPPGISGVRVVTYRGVSPVRLILIDPLATVEENGDNKSPAKAQPVTLPVAVEGRCEPESYDFFKFTATAGQRVALEVFAQRLGSSLDPVIRILDATGRRELAFCDDTPGVGADSRLEFKIPADGDYLVEIRDIRYQGGGNHRYRLRMGDFPLVCTPFPLAVQRGVETKIQLLGATGDLGPTVSVTGPADPNVRQWWLGTPPASGNAIGFTSVIVSDLPELQEVEPNNDLATATPVTFPAGWNGRFAQAKDRDHYVFEAKKGQRLAFRGQTRNLGLPTDLFLRLYRPDGGKLAEVEDTGTSEGTLEFTVPDDGKYVLAVEDLLRRGGPTFAYRMVVEVQEPGFTLQLENPAKKDELVDRVQAPKGGVWQVKVEANRRDYNGPIELSVEGLGDGLQLTGTTIAEKKNDTLLTATLPADWEPGAVRVGRIVGKAKIGEQEVIAIASVTGSVQTSNGGAPFIPAAVTQAVALGVGPKFPEFFKLTAAAPEVVLGRGVDAQPVVIKAERKNGFKEPVTLAAEGLPAGVTAEVTPIPGDKGEISVKFKANPEAALGEHQVRVVGSATFQLQPGRDAVEGLKIRVLPPLEVKAALAGPLTLGGKQKLTVNVTRAPGVNGVVAIGLKNLPAGVSVADGLTIPADQSELVLELAATGDAPASVTENVQVTGSLKQGEQTLAAESNVLSLAVQQP